MNEKELWGYFWQRKVFHAKPLDRDFIWVTQKDFEAVEKYFATEFNIVHEGKSMRSRGLLGHLHAVYQGEYVWIHQDTGNIARFFPLGIIHFFCDVLPYLILGQRRGVSSETFYQHPQKTD